MKPDRGPERHLILVPATLEPPPGLHALLDEIGQGEAGFGGELDYASGKLNINELLVSLVRMAAGEGLPEGWVPATTSWLLDEQGEIVGMSRLRHSLTPFLLDKGGNIGYYIKQAERGKGLGTEILRQTLELARSASPE